MEKNGKVKVRGKLGSLSINFTLGYPADIKQQRHITCAPSHIQAYTQRNVCMQTHNIAQTRPFLPTTPPFFLTLSDTHMLRSSMVGSDTKLMPCHTGCQQISQWITPQPLDVHRAKGHKHGSKRVEEEASEAGNEKA